MNLVDVVALQEAADAVERLRAALSASAAAEEAARLEADSLRAALARQQSDDDRLYHDELRQQAETMRLQVRIGELQEVASLRSAAAESSAVDVACIQRELALADEANAELAMDLVAQRMHFETQMKTLHSAREREGAAHEERLALHSENLVRLRSMMEQEQRVDTRIFLEQLQPVYQRLDAGLRRERELSSSLGALWANAEVEAALLRAATAEARLAKAEAAKERERADRSKQQAAERAAVQASAQLQVDQIKEHLATVLSEAQEKEARSRSAQQALLESLNAERDGFYSSLKAIQAQLSAARQEAGRAARISNHLVAKVMAAWERQKLSRLLLGWRAVAFEAAHERLWARSKEHEHELSTSLSAAAAREEAARLAEEHAAAALVEAEAERARLAEAQASLQAEAERRREQQLQQQQQQQQQLRSEGHSHSHSHRRRSGGSSGYSHRHHRMRSDLPTVPTMGPAAAAASAMSTLGRASDSSAFSATKGKHEPQERYLEYLKQCLRQGRSPAEEVVEVMRQNMPTAGSGAMAAASTLALQIRAAEEQLGLAPVPVPISVVAGWLALPTGSSI
jgi:hypothetical protein